MVMVMIMQRNRALQQKKGCGDRRSAACLWSDSEEGGDLGTGGKDVCSGDSGSSFSEREGHSIVMVWYTSTLVVRRGKY